MAKKKKMTEAQLKALEALEKFEAAAEPESPVATQEVEMPAPPGPKKGKKKGKMSEAQLKSLEALEAFEASQDSQSEDSQSEPAPAAVGGKKKGKKGKNKMSADQLKALEALEQFEASQSEPAAEPSVPEPVQGKGKKGKKGKMSEAQLRSLEALEQFESSQASTDLGSIAEESEEELSEEAVQEKVVMEVASSVSMTEESEEEAEEEMSLDMLFEEDDGGRPGGKKKGKKGGKTAKKKAKAHAQNVDALGEDAANALQGGGEDGKRKRPPPRVRIDKSSQPDYVSLRMEKIAITFKNQDVLTDATWGVQSGDRVGLVGANGGGKTTQLRILYGELDPDSGDIIKSAEDLKIAFLRQEFVDELVPSRTLKEEMMSVFTEEAEILKELDGMDEVLAKCTEDPNAMQDALDRMAELQNMVEQKGINLLDSKVEKIIDLMGFQSEEADALVASFSGGWKMRIGLGKILLTDPNILLLDEPTNHLDLESIEWMEDFLQNQKIPMVIVSHDREFLDRVCTKIVDCENGVTAQYDGNYSRFLKLKQARFDAWKSAYDAQMKKAKAEKDWINRFKSGAQAAQAASRQKKLDKMMASDEWVRKPPTPGKKLRFRFPPSPRIGDGYAICDIREVSHGYDKEGAETLFSDVNMSVEKGERVAFLGPNGCGKSTLLRLVVGKEKARSGEIRLGGQNLVVNYYEQNQADALDLDQTVIQCIQEAADGTQEYEELRALLGQFLFKGDTVQKKIGMLSGGEKARVALCRMMLRPANLLVLDEPTNHLDIPAKEMLEEALQHYDGTLLLISHDRYFVSQVGNVIAAFEDGEIVRYNGDYRFYMDKNEALRNKVESRYVDGVDGIKELREVQVEPEVEKKKKNFGGSAVTSGKKNKGVKNAKRMGDL